MVRWSTELPRLIPLAIEALREHDQQKSQQDISKQIVAVEDTPGLTFGPNPQRTFYPVLLMIKNSPFSSSELALINERVSASHAKIIAMPHGYVQPPYNKLFMVAQNNSDSSQDSRRSSLDYDSLGFMKPPTDDSPFFFANEQIPSQMILLIETVLGVSATIGFVLVYYSKANKIKLSSSSRFHILFSIFIGLGFIFLEITFIQKFLLMLGTPIMALSVILFSILLSTGIGAYLSGKLFGRDPYKAILVSIPPLIGIVLLYYFDLQGIIDNAIVLSLTQRIALAFLLLFPAGFLMGFQFPSISRMASFWGQSRNQTHREKFQLTSTRREDITLLWGMNIVASVVGTVLTATLSMTIGFDGNLLIGAGLYLGAITSAIVAEVTTIS